MKRTSGQLRHVCLVSSVYSPIAVVYCVPKAWSVHDIELELNTSLLEQHLR